MAKNDIIIIGPFRYQVLKKEAHRMLVSWVESTGIYKETWIILKNNSTIKA